MRPGEDRNAKHECFRARRRRSYRDIFKLATLTWPDDVGSADDSTDVGNIPSGNRERKKRETALPVL